MSCGHAIQVAATRTDDPGAPAKIDEARDGDGEWCTGVESVAATTADKYFVRFGLAYAVKPGESGLVQADVSLTLSYTQCGKIVGGKALSLVSSSNTDTYAVVTGWVPALMVQKVKAMVVARSLDGNFEGTLCATR